MDRLNQHIIETIKDKDKEIEFYQEKIKKLQKEQSLLKQELPKVYFFTSTSRTWDRHGNIICAGTQEDCISYIKTLYPNGSMINDRQFTDDTKDSDIILAVLNECDEYTAGVMGLEVIRKQKR